MKLSISPVFRVCLSATLGVAALGVLTATAQVRPTHRPDVPNFDKRDQAAAKAAASPAVNVGLGRLKQVLPTVDVQFDGLLQTPRFIHDRDGFLTGPGGQGRSVAKASASLASDPHAPIKSFITEHSDLFGFDAQVLSSARIKRDYVTSHNGLRTVVWEQELDGVPVFQGILSGHITRQGELVSLSSLFVPNPAAAADAATPNRQAAQKAPRISAEEAIVLSAKNIGFNLAAADLRPVEGRSVEGGYREFTTPQSALVRMVWLPLRGSALRLGWEVLAQHTGTKEMFQTVVDAQTGEVWLRRDLSCYISDATYNIYPSDSPSPFSPGLQTPGTFQPPLTSRTSVTTPAFDTTASPEGWIPDNANTTTGNNIDAFVDRDFNQQPDQPRPVGNPFRVFDFPLDLTQDPTNYIDASTVQLFYHGNLYHDRLYQLGFTEAAGNYQENNFGRGGLGGDSIICYVQAGADVGIDNNSMFAPAPDGSHGRCFMFVFTGPNPERDGSQDQEIVYHELTHGTSWRLVGGGFALGNLQGDGMGEGWSDFYSLCLLSQLGDDPDAAYASGGYATYQFFGLRENYYFGIRHFPYCTDMTKNPFTFKDIDPAQISPHAGVPRSPLYPYYAGEASEVHHQGEVWCVTLWEVHANLVKRYGWTIGNQLTLQLVTDGMKLTPASPTFLEARDAILLADRIDNAGANASEIWRGFAKRGMGVSAKAPPSNTTSGVIEAFDMPGISVEHVVVSGGNGNGLVDPNECDDLQVYLYNNAGYLATGVSTRLVSLTPGVLVVQPVSAYPPLPDGSTNANLVPFKISIAPSFVCGLPINFSLVIKSDQATSTNLFTLESGMTNGLPVRFDNYGLTPIPDVGTTNSFLLVSNVDFAITRMTVSLQITHTYDADLVLQLVSPDGTTNLLSRNRGSSGQNYGLACAPDSRRTTFDDGAMTPISAGTPPFLGSYRPEQPLTTYAGKFGTNVNGLWQLIMSDTAAQDTGFLSCWSLTFTPTTCTDGGGECPGSDLAVGLDAAPDPVMIGNNLIYTISVTNFGPSTAKNVSVSQLLPGGVVFVDAIASQGSWSQSGGVLSATLGRMAASATATVTVIVMPSVVGTVTSSATVSSEQTDFNPGNNTAYSATRVSPPTADLAVDLRAAPSSLVVGASLSYTLSVTNFGPAGASGVFVTNYLPPEVVVTDISLTQGDPSIVSNTITFDFGTLPNGAVARATISTRPVGQGTLTASAVVVANQFDPVSANNTATAVVAVGPAADLGLTLAAFPNPAVLSSNVTFVATVTNAGPNIATNVVLNGTLPTGASVVSTTPSAGTVTRTGNSLVWALGTMNPGAQATLTIVLGTSKVGTLTASANVAAAQADLNPANNSATVSAEVTLPFINIVGAGASVTNESFFPPNGSIEIGETVTVLFRLQNIGNIQNTNLVATLLATGGVTSPSGQQSYGIMDSIGIPGVLPVARPFTFTAAGTNGGKIVATLQLRDAGGYSTNVTFTFGLPTIPIFANTNLITIPSVGSASPYPSTITVSGVTGQVGKVTATLAGFTHTYPHDVSVLLVGPTGARALLMSHVADVSSASGLNLTFDDSAPLAMPASGNLLSGAWKPTAYPPSVSFPGVTPAGPYPSMLSAFKALDPNGTWSLYVIDDQTGDAGQITSGWNLAFTSLVPVNQLADLAVSGSTSPASATAGSQFTYTFVVTNNGPNAATGVTLTNALPTGVAFVSTDPSQGNYVVNNGVVTANLATLPAGQAASVVITVTPTVAAFGGSLTSSASVWAFEDDIQQMNNRVTLVSPLSLPVTDVSLESAAGAAVVTVGSNLTYTITATNGGAAKALNVVVTDPLPAGLSYVSASTSQGAVSYAAGTFTAAVGDLLPGTAATITLSVIPTAAGLVANTAALTTDSSDSNPANNSATTTVTVENPGPKLAVSGTRLMSGDANGNGGIDAGETVTIAFSLSNTGLLDTVNLSATLLPTGGVLNPSGPATYGQVIHGGPAVAAAFTFTAGSPPNGVILATLQLRDNLTDLGAVTVVFNLPTLASVANTNTIIIPDHGPGLPYPSTIAISGLTGVVSKVQVTLAGLTHRFPSDVNALLVSPAGKSVLLMSHAGGGFSATNLNLTFDDSAAQPIPQATALVSTNYQPARYDKAVAFYPPASAGPYGYQLAALNGDDANGTWSLYILDDAVGDGGSIANGWSLDVVTVSPVNAGGEIPPPVLTAAAAGDQFHLTITGQAGATYQIQSSANLVSWSTLVTQTATNGVINYTDPITPGSGQRFYRAVLVTN